MNISLKLGAFLRGKWARMVIFAVVTGVLANFIFDYLKPKEAAPSSPLEQKADVQLSAQAMRISATSLRAIAANHLRSPPPTKWHDAERLFTEGMEQYAASNYLDSYRSFDAAYRIYNDLYTQAVYEGH